MDDKERKLKIEEILKNEYGFSQDTEVKINGDELLIINNAVTIGEYDLLGSFNGIFDEYGISRESIKYVSRPYTFKDNLSDEERFREDSESGVDCPGED